MCKSRPWRWRPITHRGHGHAPGAVWARICLGGLLLFAAGGALTLGKAHERGCDLSPASEGSGRPNQGVNHGFPTSFAASRTQREFPPPAAVWEHGKIYRPSPGRQLEASFPMDVGLQPPAAPVRVAAGWGRCHRASCLSPRVHGGAQCSMPRAEACPNCPCLHRCFPRAAKCPQVLGKARGK